VLVLGVWMDGILCTGEARSKELERKVAGSGTQNERDAMD
jgi:hypothetical protein